MREQNWEKERERYKGQRESKWGKILITGEIYVKSISVIFTILAISFRFEKFETEKMRKISVEEEK